MTDWFVYILRCADDSLYTGITNDVARRVKQHNTGQQGARYTRQRRPVTLVYCEKVDGRAVALRRELEIKALGKAHKETLIKLVLLHETMSEQPG